MAEKLTQKERLKEITDSIEMENTTLFASENGPVSTRHEPLSQPKCRGICRRMKPSRKN